MKNTVAISTAAHSGNTGQSAGASHSAGASGGKYLTFALGNEEYGLDILQVREIIGMLSITPLPRVPDFIKGVANVRGRIVPVVDLALKLGLPVSARTAQACIILLRLGQLDIGIVADRVIEVLDVPAEAIQPTPAFGTAVHTDFIVGLVRRTDAVTILMDLERVIKQSDFIPLQDAAAVDRPGAGVPLKLAVAQ